MHLTQKWVGSRERPACFFQMPAPLHPLPRWEGRTDPRERVMLYDARLEQILSKLPPVKWPAPPLTSHDRVRLRGEMLRWHFEQQNGLCAYCHRRMRGSTSAGPTRATLDHIVPQCRGGEDTKENTCDACITCNAQKADMSLAEYMKLRAKDHPS